MSGSVKFRGNNKKKKKKSVGFSTVHMSQAGEVPCSTVFTGKESVMFNNVHGQGKGHFRNVHKKKKKKRQ